MNKTVIMQTSGNAWDEESIKILRSLPHRKGIISSCIPFLKLIAVPFLFIGGIGTVKQLAPILTKGPEYEYAVEHFGASMLLLLLALAILGVGGLLWFLAEHFMFEKAPLGDLAKALVEGIERGKPDKVRIIARSICVQTEGRSNSSDPLRVQEELAMVFVRGVAFEILAETSPNEESAREMAQKAILLFKKSKDLGLNTPLLRVLLATSLRIVKADQEAAELWLSGNRVQDENPRVIVNTDNTLVEPVWDVLNRDLFFVKGVVKPLEAKTSNKFDIFDPKTGDVLLECREPDIGTVTKACRFIGGLYDEIASYNLKACIPQTGEQALRIAQGGSSGLELSDHRNQRICWVKKSFFNFSFGHVYRFFRNKKDIIFTMKVKSGFNGGYKLLIDKKEVARVITRWWKTEYADVFDSKKCEYAISIAPEVPRNNEIRQILLGFAIAIGKDMK